ncbi:MAG: ABC transporter ATP-binding protein [Candidatus Thorarchaeota archaeon]|nr:ABC transporter ATP-binding protein [Candidatus Thorarchaeota archaeon]
MLSPVIELKNLSHTYRNGTQALDGVSFTVEKGEIVGILGPNGAGKSTLVKAITGLLRPTAGSIRINGLDVFANAKQVRHVIGFVPQETALYDDLTAYETLEYHAALYGVPPGEVAERITAMLDLAGLRNRAHDLVKTYSGGMKRRLALVRAMLHDSQILILDEMSLGVDVQSRNLIWSQVKRLKAEGRTIIFCTNYMDEAEDLADRLVILDKGQIVAEGSPTTLKRDCIGEYLILISVEDRFREEANKAIRDAGHEIVQILESTDSETSQIAIRSSAGPVDLPLIVEMLRKAKIPILEMTVRAPSLGDVFLNITGTELRD